VTATVNLLAGGSVSTTTPFDFTNPTTLNEFNKCVNVSDTLQGPLGQVCVGGSPKTFTYTRTIGPFGHCGDFEVDNTASLDDSATHTVVVVRCRVRARAVCRRLHTDDRVLGWKNHAGFGPQADVVSPLLPQRLGTSGGTNTQNVTTAALAVQFLSFNGSNNVFDASNGINKLYAQLLAAKLNIANGADGSSISSTISAADAFLATHDSTSWSSLTKAQQQSVLGWMSALDNFNNGVAGPRHCENT